MLLVELSSRIELTSLSFVRTEVEVGLATGWKIWLQLQA
jgi:hypothetical protein